MTKGEIEIRTGDGVAGASLFGPTGGAGVILYMDAFGPRPALDGMAQRLAGEGYAVLVPDLFYRRAPYGPSLPVPPASPRSVAGPRRHDRGAGCSSRR